MRPLILISNDDGYAAEGIQSLIQILRGTGDLIVVAPDSARSGASLSITNTTPVKYNKISEEPGLTIYSCTGTPCDCVKLALDYLVPRRPDLIVGGINHGDNAATNAHYSGTIAITIEGTLKGIPSIGFSTCAFKSREDFTRLKSPILNIVKKVLSQGLPPHVMLNVNFPSCEKFSGIRICRMGMGDWYDEWTEREHPRGGKYYWIGGYFKGYDSDDEATDLWAIDHGYIAVTPITLDFTAYSAMSAIATTLSAE